MTQVAISESFIDALTRMDSGEARKVAGYLERLVQNPDAGATQAKIVHDARDRSVRSLRASKDLRVITHLDGDRLLLLYVDQHARAYKWARDACIECHPVTGELRIVTESERETLGVSPDKGPGKGRKRTAGKQGAGGGGHTGPGSGEDGLVPVYLCATTGDLCRLLGERGIDHGLQTGTS